MSAWVAVMCLCLIGLLLAGYPVALTLGAVALFFGSAFLGLDFFALLPLKLWGIMTNPALLAVPLFIFMGMLLDKSGLAEALLESMGLLFGRLRGGLAASVILVGALVAATSGVVGATVVTLGAIALPTMLKHAYSPALSSGVIAASGTLGQIIPPSIVLILLGDVMGVPVGRLFMGALLPSVLMVGLFLMCVLLAAWHCPRLAPALAIPPEAHILRRVLFTMLPALALMITVLGSIFLGIASPSESAAVGATGALILSLCHRRFTLKKLQEALRETTRLSSMVFLIIIGAAAFGLTFRGMGGEQLVRDVMASLPGGQWGFLGLSMALVFVLGFFIDFLQICFIVVPVLTPIATLLGIDLLWFAVLLGINLQTSFLTPPFGFSLFYLKAVAPKSLHLQHIYLGITPFLFLQLITLLLVLFFPSLVLWLPNTMDALRGL